MTKADVLVLGGGPGGYLAAERAAQGGKSVILIEKRELGGTCLNEGCVPTKTLLNSAKRYAHILDGEAFGVYAQNPHLDHKAVLQRKNKVVKTLVSGVKATMKANGVTVIKGEGKIEGKTEDGKYGYYLNKTVKAYISAGKVRNLIFTSAYEGDVFNNISVGTPLKQVAEQLPDYAFGSVNDGFLGYRTKDVYVFIYEDEISVYGYSYSEHPEFEKYIKTYLTNFDLEKFVSNVTSLWQSYDEFEYDKENQSLHLTYPYIGVMIDIEDNVASGITLYSNYIKKTCCTRRCVNKF